MSGTTAQRQCTKEEPGRLPQLDGLRGLAACGVALLYHPQSLFTAAALAEAPRALLWFQTWGWTLVDLFFLISGYIFAHVYLQGEGRLSRDRLGDFAIARIARLYPLHLLTLCFCAVAFYADPANTAFAFGAHLLMLQAFVQPTAHTFNGPSWSISIEVICYVVFALAASGGGRMLRWVAAFAITGALVHFALQGRPGGPWVGDDLPRGMLGFFLGQALWHLRDYLKRVPTLALVGILVVGLARDMGRMSSLPPLCLLAWPALLLLSLRVSWMASRPMRWLGDRSYAIYLVHSPLLLLVEHEWPPFGSGMASVWTATAVFAAAVLLVSDLCHRLVEVPSRKAIRNAWARHRQNAAQPVPASPESATAG